MAIRINSFELENVKRIKSVRLECAETGLVVIGGKNGQGKTSVLDAIAYVLGGEKFAPSNVQREGSLAAPEMKVVLSNGFIVERKGKNTNLKVTDPSGATGGQTLLNSFISELALDLPKFLNATAKEKAKTLLQIIGVEAELTRLEQEEDALYNERHAFGRIADQKRKYADELVEYPDAPDAPISASELIQSQQAILAKNWENQRKRDRLQELLRNLDGCRARILDLEAQLVSLREQEAIINRDLETAQKTAEQLQDESTFEIESKLREIDSINARVRANLDKQRASAEADAHAKQYAELTDKLEGVRAQKMALLDSANLPLPGLSIEKGELIYNGQPWDCMSGSEQLRVATAIVRRINPECGFVLLDKTEQMDLDTLREFGAWLDAEGLQAITTRVSTGGECSIIIEDGMIAGEVYEPKATPALTIGPDEW